MKGRLAATAISAALVLALAATLPDALGSVYPPPETTRSFDLGPSGWHNLVWTGPSGTEPGTALACIEGGYAIAYRWMDDSEPFERWIPGRPAMSDMRSLNKYDLLLVLITDSGTQCVSTPIEP